ncbi:MAG: hypothetical protein U0174_11210 [Polyangiaceae bacterium]
MRKLVSTLLASTIVFAVSCARFDGPPEVRIKGGESGVLPDASAPIELVFNKPFKDGTLAFVIVPLTLDEEGNLSDEAADEAARSPLLPIIQHDANGAEVGGKTTIDAAKGTVIIRPDAQMPIGQKIALLIEPGLENLSGVKTTVRTRVSFAFDLKCAKKPTTQFPSGGYFFALNVEKPLGAQIQLFGDFNVDSSTGEFKAQFTNADRNTDPSRCKVKQCTTPALICRTLPAEDCVQPSEKVASVDEFPDFIANAAPPTGYGVLAEGCIQEQPDGSIALATRSVDLKVTSPPVTVQGLTIVLNFKKDGSVLRGTGGGTGVNTFLGAGSLGPAVGTVLARSLTPDQVPPGVPKAPGR